MLYRVELRLDREALLAGMSEMRVWLDRQGYEPDLFQYHTERDGTARLRVDFKFQKEAFAFAEAFNGSLLR